MEQKIYRGAESLKKIWSGIGARRILLVCGRSFDRLEIRNTLLPPKAEVIRFSEFTSNPRREDAEAGTLLFQHADCDVILAVGGGSAIDVAKCIKLFGKFDVPLIAVPTTAGTGSESTRHAVVYKDGVKQSISDSRILPDYAVLEPALLKYLPVYQKKCTILDALCQGIESWWSVNSTEESIVFARAAVEMISAHWQAYIEENDSDAAVHIMKAANLSGRAINITATTASHAMSYKLTSLYGLPHGHAVALCMREVWPYIIAHMNECVDPRGVTQLESVMREMKKTFSQEDYCALLTALGMEKPTAGNRGEELALLTESVNPERLKNSPVALNAEVIHAMYERILF